MSKILISPVGVGVIENRQNGDQGSYLREKREYRKATYKFTNSDKSYYTSFVAAALAEHLGVDKIFMVGTNKSMWEEVYRYFGEIDTNPHMEDAYFQLMEKIERETLMLEDDDLTQVSVVIDQFLKKRSPQAVGGSLCKIIKPGITEEELFHNLSLFMDLAHKIEPGDEIILDITHSFRSLPMFMYLMLDFIRNLRQKENITLSGIYYGMLDISGELGYAPVVDLKPFFALTDWSRGVYHFINYGNLNLIAELFPDGEIKATLQEMSQLTNLNHIKRFRQKMDRLRQLLQDERDETGRFPLLHYVKPHLEKMLDRFKGISNDAEFQFRLAEWHFENKLYANGYICLAESMVTCLTYIYGKVDPTVQVDRRGSRDRVKQVFDQLASSSDEHFKRVGELYHTVKEIRNNVAHAGYLSNVSHEEDIINVPKYLRLANALLFNPTAMKKLSAIPEIIPLPERNKNQQ